jgi:hypothetical protein
MGFLSKKRMSAVAGILNEAGAMSDRMNVMTKQVAEITHFLAENSRIRISMH